MAIEEIKKNALAFDATVEYTEGAIVNIDGHPHQLFRNPFLNNDLIWTPLGVPPIGYQALN
jgi:hypothetical protein